ncbi:uncharacterized protein F4812DRAFT_381730 [Daldinia caldariorum]|uniref:uncharacterized protein n=1 Tax=Daldinia caldariorum TaxID=326644 RepID=UPI0020075DB9|nr:uncharacterized protein F4812DRAFT_381730 [Daldinia caldariorum]KAI1467904.1 hypothetical protein F4812DRAFT_381730 [Daldinia caldariorum]
MEMGSVTDASNWRKSPSPGNEAQEKYQCPRCPSSFKRPEHLKRHQRSHDGHKPFVCSICLKRFFRSDILTRHELMHIAAQRNSHVLNRKRACTECARARERCSRDEPCLRCSTKSLQCFYPDDTSQRSHSFGNESSAASGSEQGQIEDYHRYESQCLSMHPKQENFATTSASNLVQRKSVNEDDGPLREFIRTLRSPVGPSFMTDADRPSNLPFKPSIFHQDHQSSVSSLATLSGIAGEPGGFDHRRLKAASRQASLFDQPGNSPFARAGIHDPINLGEGPFGQALGVGEYSNLCPSPIAVPAEPPFDFHPEAPLGPSSEMGPGTRVSGNIDPFLPMRAGGHGVVDLSEASALAPTTTPTTTSAGAAPLSGLLSMSDFRSRPINLKAYEVIASNFKELSLEFGRATSSTHSNDISESQRTAQHELLVKLYYEHFKQQAY